MAIHRQSELSSGVYGATLLDEDGDVVTSLDSLVVWLRDVTTGTIINSRNGQSILNENGGTFAAGVLTWEMSPDDHAIISTRETERHEAEFDATWDSGEKRKTWTVQWLVTNLYSVTSGP